MFLINKRKEAENTLRFKQTRAQKKKKLCDKYHKLFQVGFVFLSFFFLLNSFCCKENEKNDCMNMVV